MANEAVRHLKDAEFRAFLEEKSVALVDFWASWCGDRKSTRLNSSH